MCDPQTDRNKQIGSHERGRSKALKRGDTHLYKSTVVTRVVEAAPGIWFEILSALVVWND
jgi:hypothetical protein